MSSSSSPVLNSELVVALKRLKLGRIADTLPERLVLADKQEMTFDDLLLLVLTDEIARRDNTAAELRASEARLDPAMRLETWDKTSKVSFDKRMLAAPAPSLPPLARASLTPRLCTRRRLDRHASAPPSSLPHRLALCTEPRAERTPPTPGGLRRERHDSALRFGAASQSPMR